MTYSFSGVVPSSSLGSAALILRAGAAKSDVDIANTTDPQRLAGVKEDIQLANSLGMPVIVNFHHHQDMNNAAANVENDPESFQAELQKFVTMWTQVAAALNSIPDDMIVFEIMNEPHDIKKSSTVNEIMTASYNAIRAVAPTKTIMFEGNGYSKFAEIKKLDLPKDDGNIIVSGHYYDPYAAPLLPFLKKGSER